MARISTIHLSFALFTMMAGVLHSSAEVLTWSMSIMRSKPFNETQCFEGDAHPAMVLAISQCLDEAASIDDEGDTFFQDFTLLEKYPSAAVVRPEQPEDNLFGNRGLRGSFEQDVAQESRELTNCPLSGCYPLDHTCCNIGITELEKRCVAGGTGCDRRRFMNGSGQGPSDEIMEKLNTKRDKLNRKCTKYLRKASADLQRYDPANKCLGDPKMLDVFLYVFSPEGFRSDDTTVIDYEE